VIFHTAAYFREYYNPGDHSDAIELTNVRGTLELAQAAHAMGVGKMIYTSSAGIIGLEPDGSLGDERTPPWPGAARNLYFMNPANARTARSCIRLPLGKCRKSTRSRRLAFSRRLGGEIKGRNPAIAGNDEISPGVSWRLPRAALSFWLTSNTSLKTRPTPVGSGVRATRNAWIS